MQLAFVYFVFAHCCCCLTVFFFCCLLGENAWEANEFSLARTILSLLVMRANGRARQQITNVHSSLIRLCDPIQNIGVASAYLSLSNKNDAIICHNHFIIFFGRFSDWRGCCCCCDFLHCARVFSTMPNAWSHHMKLSRQKKMKGQQPCDVADRELEFSISRKQRMIPTR